MKKVKILVLIFLAIIAILFFGILIAFKMLDINSFRGQITQEISKSINREVKIGQISLKCSIQEGATLNISGLTVMDSPDFSSEAMFYVDSTHLNVDILPLMFKREILISNVKLDSFKVNLIRNSEGKLNVQHFSKQEKGQSSGANPKKEIILANSSKVELEKPKKPITFGDLLVKSILITDGTFIFTDQVATSAMVIPVKEIELQVLNLSLDSAFPFHVDASLWSDKQNIRMSGLSRIDVRSRQVRVDDLKIKMSYSDMEFAKIEKSIPAIASAGIGNKIGGRLAIDVSQMIFSEKGLLVLSSEGRLTDGEIDLKNSPFPIKGLSIHFELSESDLGVKEVKMPLASGEVNFSGKMVEYLKEMKFLGSLNINNIHLNELAAFADLPFKIEGKVHGNFEGSGTGLSAPALTSSLAAKGNLEVKEGRLRDVNVLKLVLSKLSFIPNLVSQVEANLPDKYKEKLTQNDTVLEKVALDTRIRNGVLVINQAELNADGFLVLAKGDLDVDENLSLSADFYIAQDLSKSLVASSQELSYLLNERGQIHIPLKPYRGKLANFRMYPNVGDLGKRVIQDRGKEELRKVLRKALDLGELSPNPAKEGETGQQKPEVSPEDQIIGNILDMIPNF